MSDFDFSQFEKFAKDFNIARNEFEDFLKGFLLEMALRVVKKTKERTPVDTGALRAMWGIGNQKLAIKSNVDKWGDEHITVDNENTQVADISLIDNNFEVVIWNAMEYASHIEYGTPNRPDWKWADGAHMLTISMDEVQKQMPKRFEKAFKQFLESNGVINS